MIRLHYHPGNASLTPHMLLEELGVPFELLLVDRANAAHKSPAYLKLNPNGLIPVLVDGDLVLYETAAICLHLADTHPHARLAPPLGSAERAHFYKWLVWCSATLQAMLMHYFYGERMVNAGDAGGGGAGEGARGSARGWHARSAGCATGVARSGLAARSRLQRGRPLCADAVPLDARLRATGARPAAPRAVSAARAGAPGRAARVRDGAPAAAAGLKRGRAVHGAVPRRARADVAPGTLDLPAIVAMQRDSGLTCPRSEFLR